jgi:PAS domain S-box-containing protein
MHIKTKEKDRGRTITSQAPLSPGQTTNLLHELQVHQIELEMQNEELRSTQAQLEASRTRYFELYDMAPVGYLTLNEKGLILEANLTAARLIGAPRSALVGKPLTRFIHRGDQDVYYLHRKMLFDDGGMQACELRLKKNDGAFFWAQMEATISRGVKDETVCHVVIDDITGRKRVEESLLKAYDTLERRVKERTAELENANKTLIVEIAQRKSAEEKEKSNILQLQQADKMASLGALVTGVAHEINNPNNFIMLNSTLLKQAWEDARPILDEYFDANGDFRMAGINYSRISQKIPLLFSGMENGARRIQRIVADLKNYARRDLSDYDSTVEINQVVKNAVSLLESMIAKKTSRFTVTYAPLPVHIRGNGQKLEQVIINLIQNGCEALASPEAVLAVRVDRKNATCVISVRDEGQGISTLDIPKLTDPFFTTKRESGGTGLGLSVSAGIVKEHGGDLEFESKVGKGTIARVILPLKRNKEDAQ